MNSENITFEPAIEEISVKKKKRKIIKIIIGVVLFSLFSSPFYFLCADFGIIPNKLDAKSIAKHHVENIVDIHYNANISDINIKSCKHESFIKESKDKYRFFDYAMNPSITVRDSGKEYANYEVFLEEKYGVDIYTTRKHIYTIKGNCTIMSNRGISSKKDFTVIIVHLSGTDFMMSIDGGNIFDENQDNNRIVENYAITHSSLIQNNITTSVLK